VRDALGKAHTILVLGGGSDIGQAIAGRLVDDGAEHVILAGRHPDRLDGAAEQLRRRGAVSVESLRFDADDFASHRPLIEEVRTRHRDIDVVVVAFGVLGGQTRAEHDPTAATAIAITNYVGAVSVLTVVAEHLRAQGHGAIVVLSSAAGERVRRANYVYGSSKAGLDGFCQGLSAALIGSGVHLCIVRPGYVHSRMTAGLPAAPLATTPDAVALATLTGLRRRSAVVWVPAALRPVMAVVRHLPRAVFARLPEPTRTAPVNGGDATES